MFSVLGSRNENFQNYIRMWETKFYTYIKRELLRSQVCKTAKGDSYRRHVWLSVLMYARYILVRSEWIFIKFYIWRVFENLSRSLNFTKIWQEWQVLHVNHRVHISYYLAEFFLEWELFRKKFVVEIRKHFTFSKFFRNRGSLLEKYGMAR